MSCHAIFSHLEGVRPLCRLAVFNAFVMTSRFRSSTGKRIDGSSLDSRLAFRHRFELDATSIKAALGWIAWVASIVWVSGCSLLSVPEEVSYLYKAKGKLSITHGQERSTVNFVWREGRAESKEHQIDLWGALGRGYTQIRYQDGTLQVSRPDGQVLSGDEANELVDSLLGADFPLSVLPYWLRFEPDGSRVPYTRLQPKRERLSGFRQLGWSIELLATHPDHDMKLPSRLAITKGGTRLLVVVKDWEISAVSHASSVQAIGKLRD